MGSGSLSLPCSGCFSPFPHGTGSLSVSWEYLALPDGPGGFTQDSSCPALLRSPLCFGLVRIRSFHALWPCFPARSSPVPLATTRSYNPADAVTPAVWALLGESFLFSFPAGTKMFQFPALASAFGRMLPVRGNGLSHSEIRGSRVICT